MTWEIRRLRLTHKEIGEPQAPEPRERLLSCQCEGCGLHDGDCLDAILYLGDGRPPKYCVPCRGEIRRRWKRECQAAYRRKNGPLLRVRKFAEQVVDALLDHEKLTNPHLAEIPNPESEEMRYRHELIAIVEAAFPYRVKVRTLQAAHTRLGDGYHAYFAFDPRRRWLVAATLVPQDLQLPGLREVPVGSPLVRQFQLGLVARPRCGLNLCKGPLVTAHVREHSVRTARDAPHHEVVYRTIFGHNVIQVSMFEACTAIRDRFWFGGSLPRRGGNSRARVDV